VEQEECLNRFEGGCVGSVVGRPSEAGTGTIIFRCTAHAQVAADRAEEIRSRYPDSSTPPDWFDPTAAGETWDDEY
jgi:hypothetical protein